MQRPVMNPNFFEDAPTRPSGARRLISAVRSLTWRCIRTAWRVITYDPLSRIPGFRVEEGTPTSRFIRALLYRLAFVPVLVAGSACAFVWVSTHPRTATAELDPGSQNVYFEAVTVLSSDQTKIEGWLVPVIDAKTVLEEKDKVLWNKHAAVVLVHDIGQRRDQLLGLIRPLHDAGYVVLAVNLRGGGKRALMGETFGLHESADVRAAVEMLRRRPFVDPNKIVLIGYGTGATASLLAARADEQIAAVVADRPMRDGHDLVKSRLVPQVAWVNWMAPLCKWTFELSYGVDVDELQMSNFRKLFDTRPVLLIDAPGQYADPSDPRTADQMKSFLGAALSKDRMAFSK